MAIVAASAAAACMAGPAEFVDMRIVPGAGHGCGLDGLDKWLFSREEQ